MPKRNNPINTQANHQGKRVKYLREITHLSRRAFALKHGLSPGTLQNCEDGRYGSVTPRTAAKLVLAFQMEGINCQLDWLLYGTGEPPKHPFHNLISEHTIQASPKNKFTSAELLQLAIKNEEHHKKNEALFEAAANGRYREIIRLLESGIDAHLYEGLKVKRYESEHNTLLHLASQNGYLDIVKFLIKKSASINSRNRKNQNSLHLAVHNAHKEIIAYLLEHGIDINAKDDEGDTALAWAAYRGQTDVVKQLLEYGSNIHTRNNMGNSPLHWAAEKGYTDIVKLLITYGANPENTNNRGNTPILEAAYNGRIDTVKFLLDLEDKQSRN